MTTPAVADTTDAQLEEVIAAAATAAPMLATRTPAEIAEWLDAAADALDARGRRAGSAGRAEETHLPAKPRLAGELLRTTFQLRFFGNLLREGAHLGATIDHADPNWPMGPRPDIRRHHVPFGPVLVFAASNFPFAFSVAGGDTASALAAGCPVILKAHPGHPRLSDLTGKIVRRRAGQGGRAVRHVRGHPRRRRRRDRAARPARSPRPRSPVRCPVGGRCSTSRLRGRRRSRSTANWAASTRSWSRRARCASAAPRSSRAMSARSPLALASSAPSRACCSCRKATALPTNSPTPSARPRRSRCSTNTSPTASPVDCPHWNPKRASRCSSATVRTTRPHRTRRCSWSAARTSPPTSRRCARSASARRRW